MKNLKLLNKSCIHAESIDAPDLPLVDAAFDLISDSITLVLGSQDFEVLEVQQLTKNGNSNLLASSIPYTSDLLSFQHFEDMNQLVFVFANGDIMTNDYNTQMTEIIGSIDSGIKTAKWSHDEEILAIITNDHNVLLFSRLLDLITEFKIDSNDLMKSNQVSLGWGKEETQFKGKGAKQLERERKILQNAGLNIDSDNAILCDPTIKKLQKGSLSEADDKTYKISWRGDCQFFSISCVEKISSKIENEDEPNLRRVIRVYSKDGEWISTSEPTDGQEHTLSWKPQGSLIASTQRRFEPEINDFVLDVIFFEKNGLRHGEFDSRSNEIVNLDWSSNSEILLLQLKDRVQLWYTKNYHWYLKQEYRSDDEILYTKFHPENPFKLMIVTKSNLEILNLSYDITNGSLSKPVDNGVNLVIDGQTLLLTPFAKANVPPPIAYRDIDVDENILSASISKENSILSILTNDKLYIFSVDEMWNSKELLKVEVAELIGNFFFRSVHVLNDMIYILFDNLAENTSNFAVLNFSNTDISLLDIISVPNLRVISVYPDIHYNQLYYQTIDGSVYLIDDTFSAVSKFPQICPNFKIYNKDALANEENLHTFEQSNISHLAIGLTSSGKLYSGAKLITQGVTSMLVTDEYLIFTTAKHQLKFINLRNSILFNDEEYKSTDDETSHDETVRNIERGSILVNAIPSKSSVILQAPRGNLETIYPRILVLNDIRNAINNKNWYSAFMTCRVHRIALDILHDYKPQLFFDDLENFIKSLNKVEYLDLFLSCLIEDDVCLTKYKETNIEVNNEAEHLQAVMKQLNIEDNRPKKKVVVNNAKVRKICDGVLKVLAENPIYKEKYMQSMITAYASQKPPRTEEALTLISTFNNDEEIEKSVQHLCFLLDVNKLYNIALSIYNIPLSLIIAQQSQKDPKEYLPFLQKLYEESELRRKFLIDSHLKNYSKALGWLVQIEDVEFEEITDFIINYELYSDALSLFKYKENEFNKILKIFADYLHDKKEFSQSSIIYEKLNEFDLALSDYIMCKKWREAISICLKPDFKFKLDETCEKLVEDLVFIHDYKSAAYISLKFLKNLENALTYYGKEYEYATAIQLCYEEDRVDLIDRVVDPSINEGFSSIAELLADCKGQIESQLRRLRELREKKLSDPFAFYGENADNVEALDNVSIAPSEASTKESFFTRYTGKTSGTAKTGASRRTAKNKRREERKKARGKKGTIYEEEYLISSVGRLIERLEKQMDDAVKLIEAMVRRNMMEKAYLIQFNFVGVLNLLKENVDEIYTMDKRDRERIDDNGLVYYIDEIPVPNIKSFPTIRSLDY